MRASPAPGVLSARLFKATCLVLLDTHLKLCTFRLPARLHAEVPASGWL